LRIEVIDVRFCRKDMMEDTIAREISNAEVFAGD
jgi:hypothetical protein